MKGFITTIKESIRTLYLSSGIAYMSKTTASGTMSRSCIYLVMSFIHIIIGFTESCCKGWFLAACVQM